MLPLIHEYVNSNYREAVQVPPNEVLFEVVAQLETHYKYKMFQASTKYGKMQRSQLS